MKVAIGIPFRASVHDVALRLCIRSLQRYAGLDFDLFLLLDAGTDGDVRAIDESRYHPLHPGMRTRKSWNTVSGRHKHEVVEWVCRHENAYDLAFFMHSDIFLYREGLLPLMVRRLAESSGVSCHWTAPLCEFRPSRLLYSESVSVQLVAPRISSWLFCLDCRKYRALKRRFPLRDGYFVGHHEYRLDDAANPLVAWIRSQPGFSELSRCHKKVFCDIGTYFRYVLDIGKQNVFVMGTADSPEMQALEPGYKPEGFAHIEKFNDRRFVHSSEARALFARREELVRNILRERYGEEG